MNIFILQLEKIYLILFDYKQQKKMDKEKTQITECKRQYNVVLSYFIKNMLLYKLYAGKNKILQKLL